MAYDEAVAERVRGAPGKRPDIVEKRMFGGVALDFTGRPMKGLVYVEPAGFASPRDLKKWVERALEFARSLPAK